MKHYILYNVISKKSIAKIHFKSCCKNICMLFCSADVVVVVDVTAEHSSCNDLDSSALDVTWRSEVVHHTVTAALLLTDLEAPHGIKLVLGHLHRLLENNPGDRLKERGSGERARIGEECLVSREVLGGVNEVLVLVHALVLGWHRAQVATDLLQLLVSLPCLQEHPKNSEAVRLVHGLGGVPVLGVVVDDVELRVILLTINGVLAASLASLLSPVSVHLEDLVVIPEGPPAQVSPIRLEVHPPDARSLGHPLACIWRIL